MYVHMNGTILEEIHSLHYLPKTTIGYIYTMYSKAPMLILLYNYIMAYFLCEVHLRNAWPQKHIEGFRDYSTKGEW